MNRITKRWEEGTTHDPRSVAIFKGIAKIDFEECSDSFCFKSGGDGDNGETLMYLLDAYFEDEDKKTADQPTTFVASLSNPTCAPLEERCDARAIVWRLDVPWRGPPRLCACCHAIWTQHGVGHHYGPVPTERIALLGCDAMVRR